MSLKDQIRAQTTKFLATRYTVTDSRVVPTRTHLTFGGTARRFFARVLYFDLRGSRYMLFESDEMVSLRAHKAFLYAAGKCVRAEGGELRGFAGDSVLAFFIGKGPNGATKAIQAAMKTKWAVQEIVNPMLEDKYGERLEFGAGVAQGNIVTGKSGVAGNADYQDLIWIGRAVYHAVQCGERASDPKSIWISKNVFNSIKADRKMTHSNDKHMWVWTDEAFATGTYRVYKTSYRWRIK